MSMPSTMNNLYEHFDSNKKALACELIKSKNHIVNTAGGIIEKFFAVYDKVPS